MFHQLVLHRVPVPVAPGGGRLGASEDPAHQGNHGPPPELPNFTPIFVPHSNHGCQCCPLMLLSERRLLSHYQTTWYYPAIVRLACRLMHGHDSSRPDNVPIGVTILTCVRRTTPPPNERSHMVIIRQKVSRAANGKWQASKWQMTCSLRLVVTKPAKEVLEVIWVLRRWSPQPSLSLSPSTNFRRQFLEVLSHKCRKITNPSDVDWAGLHWNQLLLIPKFWWKNI